MVVHVADRPAPVLEPALRVLVRGARRLHDPVHRDELRYDQLHQNDLHRRFSTSSRASTGAGGKTHRRGARGGRGRLPRARGALSRAPAGALLPDARLAPRLRGRAAGDAAARLARPRGLRGGAEPAPLALPDRHQRLHRPARQALQAGPASGRADVVGPGAGPGHPAYDAPWLEPYPDAVLGVEAGYASPEARYEERESVELAFIAALQQVPPNQRAVLVLRDVLGLSARETAEALDTSVPSANSALQRARETMSERLPLRSQQSSLRALGDRGLRRLVEAYVEAWESARHRGDRRAARGGRELRHAAVPELVRGRATRSPTSSPRTSRPRASATSRPARTASPRIGWYLWDRGRGLLRRRRDRGLLVRGRAADADRGVRVAGDLPAVRAAHPARRLTCGSAAGRRGCSASSCSSASRSSSAASRSIATSGPARLGRRGSRTATAGASTSRGSAAAGPGRSAAMRCSATADWWSGVSRARVTTTWARRSPSGSTAPTMRRSPHLGRRSCCGRWACRSSRCPSWASWHGGVVRRTATTAATAIRPTSSGTSTCLRRARRCRAGSAPTTRPPAGW